MFDTTQPGASGITAQAPKARVKLTRGASRKTTLSAPAGTTISLRTNFRKSAKDCKRPKGPTTLGPLRICTPAQILRSASSRKAKDNSIHTRTARICRTVTKVQPTGEAQKPMSPIALLRRHLRAGGESGALRHGDAGAGDRVGEVEGARCGTRRIAYLAVGGVIGEEFRPELVEGIVRQPGAQMFGESTQYRPV